VAGGTEKTEGAEGAEQHWFQQMLKFFFVRSLGQMLPTPTMGSTSTGVPHSPVWL
jgi:hypothetical protein